MKRVVLILAILSSFISAKDSFKKAIDSCEAYNNMKHTNNSGNLN